jgi:hypothetical protein
MYYLSGKYIPSSVVLNAMADAAAESNVNAKAEVQLPTNINDEGPEWAGFGNDDESFKKALYAHWKEEFQEAKAAAKWSMSFTLKIKDILGMA